MLVKGAALDVDFDLDVAEATEGEAEEVVVGGLDVVAVEAGEFTVADFDDGVGGEGFLGEFDVILADDAGDSLTESLDVAVGNLGEFQTAGSGARHGSLWQEELDIGVIADVLIGYGLLHTADEEHAGDEVAVDHPLGAVGVDVEHLFAGDVGFPGGCSGAFAEVIDTGVGVLLMGQQGHKPLAVGYGRATRFVHLSTYRTAWRNLRFVHNSVQRYKENFI